MHSEESKSNAQANLNTVLGSIGTAGVAGFFNNGLGGIFGGNRPPMEPPATKSDLSYERQLTSKDMEIAQLKAEKYADTVVLAAERRLTDKIEEIKTTVNTRIREQDVLNAHQTDAIAMVQGEVQRLKSVFNMYINAPVMAASEAAWNAMKPAAASSATAG